MVSPYERDAIRPHLFGNFPGAAGRGGAPPGDALLPRQLGLHPRGLHRPEAGEAGAERELRPRAPRAAHPRRRRRLHAGRRPRGRPLLHRLGHPEAAGGGHLRVPSPGARPGTRSVSSGWRFPPGGGIEDGEKVLDLLAAHPSTARFVARKLAQKFVTDQPPPALVERLAAGVPADARRPDRGLPHALRQSRVLERRGAGEQGEDAAGVHHLRGARRWAERRPATWPCTRR